MEIRSPSDSTNFVTIDLMQLYILEIGQLAAIFKRLASEREKMERCKSKRRRFRYDVSVKKSE